MPSMSASPLVAAAGVAVVWIAVGLITTAVFLIMLIALVRHVILLGRSVSQFNEETGPILEEMSQQRAKASASARGAGPQGGGPARGGGRR